MQRSHGMMRGTVLRMVLGMAVVLLVGAGFVGAGLCRAGEDKPKAEKLSVTVRTDREDARYALGETAAFVITVRRSDEAVTEGSVRVTLRDDFSDTLREPPAPLLETTLPLSADGARVTIASEAPGFVTCRAAYVPETGQPVGGGLAAVAFAPGEIEPAAAEPEDFDAFWAAAREERDAIPVDARVTPWTKWKAKGSRAWKLSLANIGGTRAWGYLTVPEGDGPFPLVVQVPGANLRAPSAPMARHDAVGAMQLIVSVHAHDPNMPKAELDRHLKEDLWNYIRLGAPDREACYWKRAVLGVDRMIEYVASEYPWDGKHCVMVGGSQGGAFALLMAGFNRQVTACAADKPALCDHAGYTVGRGTGWPNLASWQEPAIQDATLRMSGYFDTIFFARRVRVPAVVGVGFIDGTCPPSGVYAAYNGIPGPKRIFDQPRVGHGFGKHNFDAFVKTWLPGQLGRTDPAPPTAAPDAATQADSTTTAERR